MYWMDASGPDLAIAFYCVVAGGLAMITNGILLLLIACNKDLRRKDYIRFILSRTLADFVYSIVQAAIQPAAIFLAAPSSPLCTAAGFLEVATALCSCYSEPMLACNRYISIFHGNNHKKIYSSRNVHLICLAVWLFGLACTVPNVIIGSLGRTPGSFCSVKFSPENMIVIVLSTYSFMFTALGSIVFFNYKMFAFLKKHQNQPMTNSQRSKLQSDREMLKFIFVAAFFPLVFQVPTMIVLWVQMVIPVSAWFGFYSLALFMVAFVLNPVIAMLMVRPIRNQLVTKVKRFMGRHVSTVQVEPGGGNSQVGQVSGGNLLIKVEELRMKGDRDGTDVRRRMSVPM